MSDLARHEAEERAREQLPAPKPPSQRWNWVNPLLLMSPALLILLFFFVTPLATLFVYSFYKALPGGQMVPTFTWENYTRFLTEPFHLSILWNTLKMGFSVTVFSALLGLPVAYTLARTMNRQARGLLISLLLVPLMTSVVVRSYGWMILLGSNGVVNRFLLNIGLVREPLKLLYTETGTVIALVAVLLPFMVLSLVPVIQNIPRSLEQAAQSLGASEWRTFFDVVLPLSVPGLTAGSILVFSLAIAAYATPALVGGNKVLVMSLFVQQQAMALFNWPFGSAISFVLLVIVLCLTALQTRLLERHRGWSENH